MSNGDRGEAADRVGRHLHRLTQGSEPPDGELSDHGREGLLALPGEFGRSAVHRRRQVDGRTHTCIIAASISMQSESGSAVIAIGQGYHLPSAQEAHDFVQIAGDGAGTG